jgi:hydroxymethylbilane synthase
MLPISLRPNGRRAVIVGGGNVAARKAESLVGTGFHVFVVAERVSDRLRAVLRNTGGTFVERQYQPDDLDRAGIVIAATDDTALNARVVVDARAARALVCDATDPQRGDFTMAATQRVGDLTISVDSGGSSPAFSRRVARELRDRLDSSYAMAARTLSRMRVYVKETFPSTQRGAILRALAERPVDELATASATLICATRSSTLAMIQSRIVAARLAERGIATTFLPVATTGDQDQQTSLDRFGSVGVFVKELELALRQRRADYAVHSCKDLPGVLPDDMRIAAISRREDPRDAFCSERYEKFELLPAGSVVGTSSPRRRAQLSALRGDLRYEVLRGNVDTRLRKLRAGEYDAIVIAMAGLERLGAGAANVVPFSVDRLVPAVGQGALAVEVRADDSNLHEVIHEAVTDAQTEICVRAERAVLASMRAGCSAPLGVHAYMRGDEIVVQAAYAPSDGQLVRARIERACATAAQAETLGAELAAHLKGVGAASEGVEP